MQRRDLERVADCIHVLPAGGPRRVPVVFYADHALLDAMDDRARLQAENVASLPGIVDAVHVMPDGHWGYGFPIGGVAAFEPEQGVISAGGVGFDISCGVRCLLTGLAADRVESAAELLAARLFERIPAGVGSTGAIRLDEADMDAMLAGGARWAVERGYGRPEDLARIEEGGSQPGAAPEHVSADARRRQAEEMGTLGSGNHYLEVQRVADVADSALAAAYGLRIGDAVVSLHCGSRGLGHQIGTDYLREMVTDGIRVPDRELASAPLASDLGRRYLGAMRAATNCALANRQILTHLAREVFDEILGADLELLFDVSHNTCREEEHSIAGTPRRLFVHRKGATRAFGPGHPSLPEAVRATGQPVLVGGSMGTSSWVLAGTGTPGDELAFGSACHGAGRAMSRHESLRRHKGRQLVDSLRAQGILVKSPSSRGVAEEAPDAYKDVDRVVAVAERAGLARRVARLVPMVCIKG